MNLWNRSQTIPLKSMDSLRGWGDKKGECVFETRMERRRESEECDRTVSVFERCDRRKAIQGYESI